MRESRLSFLTEPWNKGNQRLWYATEKLYLSLTLFSPYPLSLSSLVDRANKGGRDGVFHV